MARGSSTLARGTGQRATAHARAGTPRRGTGSLGYIPALDGLRGAGLVFVFAFHVGYSWAAGALLALSVFFTLSGFLITRLILDEVGRTGRLNLPGFWSRRLRRLLPAAILGILFVLVLSATVLPVDPDKLRGDAFAALGYVANWRFILESRGYLEQFATPSPLLHYWSLSLEEQFYLLFPLLVAGVLWMTSSVRRFRLNLRIVVARAHRLLARNLVLRAGDGRLRPLLLRAPDPRRRDPGRRAARDVAHRGAVSCGYPLGGGRTPSVSSRSPGSRR